MPTEACYYALDDINVDELKAAFSRDCHQVSHFLVKGRTQDEIGIRNEENGPDMSDACDTCGAGWRPGTEVRTDLRLAGTNNLTFLLTGEFVISKEVRDALVSESVTGIEFLPLYSGKKQNRDQRHWILSGSSIGQEADSASWLTIVDSQKCPKCSRSGWSSASGMHGKLVYPQEVFPENADALLTWEYFGPGRIYPTREESVLPDPRLLVSQKTYRVLKHRFKVRGVEFEPVFL